MCKEAGAATLIQVLTHKNDISHFKDLEQSFDTDVQFTEYYSQGFK
jgi:hypothetical protein